MKGKNNPTEEAPKYTSRLIVRLTPEHHRELIDNASLCNLTVSAYARKRLQGEHPKQRLTEQEVVALTSLSDARGDIQKLFGFLRGKPASERERIMRDTVFMRQWKVAAQVILDRMIAIEKYITQ